MKKQNPGRSNAELIDNLIKSIPFDTVNAVEGIYLDESLAEFIQLKNEVIIPPVQAAELDLDTGYQITGLLTESIPEFLTSHYVLEKRKPSAEQHSLHFVKPFAGKLIDFVHILRLDFKLSANYGRITGKSDSSMFPSYITDRIRYKSRLVPVMKGSSPVDIESLKIRSSHDVDSDGRRFTAVFFDEFSTAELSIEFSTKAGSDLFHIPPKIYQFICYDYFTACLNIPDPYKEKIELAVEIYEPLFFYLYFYYMESGHQIDRNSLITFSEMLEISGSAIQQRTGFTDTLKKFFSNYTLYRDDDLMLKGLRKIVTGR